MSDIPSRIDTARALRLDGKMAKLALVNFALSVGSEDSQSSRTGEGGAARQAAAAGNRAMAQDVNTDRDKAATFLLQQLRDAEQTRPEVVGPLELGGVDFDAAVRNVELAAGKAVRHDVTNAHLAVLAHGDSHQEVGLNGHWEDVIQRVVDVLAESAGSVLTSLVRVPRR